jgi:nitrite reductase (cytochrome c-552)
VPETEITARALIEPDRNAARLSRGEKALVGLFDAIVAAQKTGASDTQLKAARDFQRQAPWRLDFVAAESSIGFHAPQKAARILAEGIDHARQDEPVAPATRS